MTAVALAGCGDDGNSGSGRGTERTSTPSASSVAATSPAASAALERTDAHLGGWIFAEAARTVGGCSVVDGHPSDFDCAVGAGVGGEEPAWQRIRLQADGTATKLLAAAAPAEGKPSSSEVQHLLARDDQEVRAPTTVSDYACSPSPRLDRGGQPVAGSPKATGWRCTVTQRLGKVDRVRYVEFAADGTATQDFALPER